MESAVTSLWLKVQEVTESCTLDHCQQRFPTDARDVAAVCRKLSERARQVRERWVTQLSVSSACLSPVCIPNFCVSGPVRPRYLPLLGEGADD